MGVAQMRIAWVAPYAGAWIETLTPYLTRAAAFVAPYAGAWIETQQNINPCINRNVAPYAGAWIETINQAFQILEGLRRTLRGCVD